MKKKLFTLMTIAMVLSLVFVGCSNKNNENTEESLGDIIIYDESTQSSNLENTEDTNINNNQSENTFDTTENTENNSSEENTSSENNVSSESSEDVQQSTENVKNSSEGANTEDTSNGGIISDEPDDSLKEMIYVSFSVSEFSADENAKNSYYIAMEDGKYYIHYNKTYIDSLSMSEINKEISKEDYDAFIALLNEMNWSSYAGYKEEVKDVEGFTDADYDYVLSIKKSDGGVIDAMWENTSPAGWSQNWSTLKINLKKIVVKYMD